MMVAIVKARFKAEEDQRHESDDADRGSQMGDCMEFDTDDLRPCLEHACNGVASVTEGFDPNTEMHVHASCIRVHAR